MEQYLSRRVCGDYEDDETMLVLIKALQTVHRMALKPGESRCWRPTRLPTGPHNGQFVGHRIAIRLGRPSQTPAHSQVTFFFILKGSLTSRFLSSVSSISG